MKELRNFFIIHFIVCWAIYFLLNWVFSLLGRPFDYFNIIIVGLVISFLFTIISFMIVRSLLRPKLDFLNSEASNMPPFGNKIEKSFQIERSDFAFEVIKYKIAENYKLTIYEDVEKFILKFYTGIKPSSWGVGGSIEYNAVTRTVQLSCFPFSAYTDKAAAATEKVITKVENLIINK